MAFRFETFSTTKKESTEQDDWVISQGMAFRCETPSVIKKEFTERAKSMIS